MDENTNVPEMRSGNGTPSPIRALKIDPAKWDNQRLHWLWRQMMTQDYCFDDPAKNDPRVWLDQLFMPASEWYELGEVGLASFVSIIPGLNALFHFVIWGDAEPRELFSIQRELFASAFERFSLNRITAFIPAFNRIAIRMATISGFKYEGEMRKAFLKNNIFHNVQLYGLLREEFEKREVKH